MCVVSNGVKNLKLSDNTNVDLRYIDTLRHKLLSRARKLGLQNKFSLSAANDTKDSVVITKSWQMYHFTRGLVTVPQSIDFNSEKHPQNLLDTEFQRKITRKIN